MNRWYLLVVFAHWLNGSAVAVWRAIRHLDADWASGFGWVVGVKRG